MEKYSVTEFINHLNAAFTAAVFPHGVAIEGEIAEYRVSQGKWIWFLLKDEESTLSCFATTWKLRQPLEDGMQVRVLGMPKVHPRSGKFSINVDRVEPVGEGALRRAFELLKKELDKEGLFDAGRKRGLPRFPERIGLIASRESAAYSDFLRILGNRWGGVEVNSAHVQVQGKDAVNTIVRAFDYFNAHSELAEVLVLTRGGGSLEDLHAFNSEGVARAVYASKIPVICAVGHERDESLADYVADMRASTPSNAAEIVVPDRTEFMVELESNVGQLTALMGEELSARQMKVERAVRRIENTVVSSVDAFKHRLRDLSDAFSAFATNVVVLSRGCDSLTKRLMDEVGDWHTRNAQELASRERVLTSLDPKKVLRRGYAIVRAGGRALKDSSKLKVGESIDVQLHEGLLEADVIKVLK